ncbi:MAG: flavohemoglobin expression-modulating QEGLA motif protein [Cellvibrionales bacterium]|nr:flavohemoglobin expression-modulating QEGLA motif protein [Cellvibrionales bacterium]
MLKLSETDILQRLADKHCFECEMLDGSFRLKEDSYSPNICVAIHAGSQMRPTLMRHCALTTDERFYEEDPYTEQFIQTMPITLIANDSRYEYDLNRPIANCLYTKAWGKTVWQKAVPQKERAISIAKHQTFYRVLDALIAAVEQHFGTTIIFDVHSYNYLRIQEDTPTFNLGSAQIDKDRWQGVVDATLERLGKIVLPNILVAVKENAVFHGRGYLIAHVNSRFQYTLVLPLEVKKIFMDELSGEMYPQVLRALAPQFKDALVDIATFFSRRFIAKRRIKKADILPDALEPAIIKVDQALFEITKGLETLHYINPINLATERKQFFKRNGNYQPQFKYRSLDIDPYQFRERLYRLPIDSIQDPSIQGLYRDVIDGYSKKIDLLVKAGQADFVYESLKYYGEPKAIDEMNAQFLMHASAFEPETKDVIHADELLTRMKAAADEWGMQCKFDISSKLVASAMVSHSRKIIMISKDVAISPLEARALVHHELGVHMATTLNSHQQRLKIFQLGLPGNTLTQEGLAILNEYHSGCITLDRLRRLALRVLAVKEMLNHNDFRHTYSYLLEACKVPSDQAFTLSVRVHRGGGFTKDYLYLSGVSQALGLIKEKDISHLYIGKTAFKYLDTINEMIERQLVSPPTYVPSFLTQPAECSSILTYLMACIRHPQPTINLNINKTAD